MNVKFKKTSSQKEILELLISFEAIFPHLKEKINSFEDYAKKLSEHAVVVKCLCDNKVSGLLVYYDNDVVGKVAYISLIGVFEEFQGKNIAGQILQYCEDKAIEKGMQVLKLEVDNDNTRAIKFYMKNGFTVKERLKSSFYMGKGL